MNNRFNGLPEWALRAGGRVFFGEHPLSETIERLGIELAPNNIRLICAAMAELRLELHHSHARQIALIRSVGDAAIYTQTLVRWSALERAEAAADEYVRIGREMRDNSIDMRVHAGNCHKAITARFIRSGFFSPNGEPDPVRADERAIQVTHALMRAMGDQDRVEVQSMSDLLNKIIDKKEKKSGGLDWLDDPDLNATGEAPKPPEPEIGEVIPGEITTVRIYKAAQTFGKNDESRKQTSENLEKQLELRGVATESENTEVISEVYEEHPWFAEPLDYIWKRRTDGTEDGEPWFYIPPILIWGPPGCGKTHFLSRLAELSGVAYRRIDFSSVEGGMGVAGIDARWSNSRPGAIVETIAQTGCANPLFFIDEIEKARKNHGASDPHHALLPLLQRDTARTFFDQSLSAQVDLSFVSYAFAANEIWQIPAPLMDRVRVFEVRYPRGKHLRDLIERRLIKCGASEEVIDKVHAEIEAGRQTLRVLDRVEMRLREVMRQPVLN